MNGEASMQYAVTSDATAAINSMIYAQRDLMAGFTTLRDEGAQGYSDVAVRDAINAGKIVGPRISCSGEAIGGTGGSCRLPLPALCNRQACLRSDHRRPGCRTQGCPYRFQVWR